jgi:hypothetical protein
LPGVPLIVPEPVMVMVKDTPSTTQLAANAGRAAGAVTTNVSAIRRPVSGRRYLMMKFLSGG